jgi:hypothetical protein
LDRESADLDVVLDNKDAPGCESVISDLVALGEGAVAVATFSSTRRK